MKLHLVRHGQSIGNAKPGYISGKTDPDGLTTGGRAQIVRSAWELHDLSFDRVIASPVARAQESAEILSHLLELPLTTEEFLAEFDYGVFEQSFWWHRTEEERQAWQTAMGDYAAVIPGGDSYERFSARVWDGFQRFLEGYDRQSEALVLLVAHDVVISTIVFQLVYGRPGQSEMTAAYKKAYLRFINDFRVLNGGIVSVDLSTTPVHYDRLSSAAQTVPISSETVSFYLRGMQSLDHVTIAQEYTASENKVFRVNTGDQTVIVKLMEERGVVASERMNEIYRFLAEKTKIAAPQVVFYDKSTAFFPDTVLVQDFVTGESQLDYLSAHPEKSKAVLTDTIAQIERIHAISVPDVEEFWFPDDTMPHKIHVPWQKYIDTEITETIEAVSVMSFEPAVKQNLTTTLVQLREQLAEDLINQEYEKRQAAVPLHGDLAPLNIVIGDGNGSCIRILDFERCRIGDPLWDYAYYTGWLDRDLPAVVDQWLTMLESRFSADELALFEQYRVLFHAWTVRDSLAYQGSALRLARGDASVDWLNATYSS